MYEICSKLSIKRRELYHWPCSGVFIANFEKIKVFFGVVFELLGLNSKCQVQYIPFNPLASHFITVFACLST